MTEYLRRRRTYPLLNLIHHQNRNPSFPRLMTALRQNRSGTLRYRLRHKLQSIYPLPTSRNK
jgi:hypothetical protein